MATLPTTTARTGLLPASAEIDADTYAAILQYMRRVASVATTALARDARGLTPVTPKKLTFNDDDVTKAATYVTQIPNKRRKRHASLDSRSRTGNVNPRPTDPSHIGVPGNPEEQHDDAGLCLFTDGSALTIDSERSAGWGAIVTNADAITDAANGLVITDPSNPHYIGAYRHTNNAAELCGLFWAMTWAMQRAGAAHVAIYTDSWITLNLATGRWLPKSNRRLD